MKRVFVCSALAGDFKRNRKLARMYCKFVASMGHAPFAPHIFCTQFLDDQSSEERELGMSIGLEFLRVCDELWAFYPDPKASTSTGMRREIEEAVRIKIPLTKIIVVKRNKKEITDCQVVSKIDPPTKRIRTKIPTEITTS